MKKSILISLLVLMVQVVFSQPLTNWLEFDGINDYVSLGNSSVLKPTSALTVELWAYHADWPSSNNSRLISNTSGGGYNIQIESDTLSGSVYLNGEYRRTEVALSSISEGWHHFAITCDGRYIKLYVDGELQATDDAGAGYSLVYDSDNCTLLGAEAGDECSPSGDYLNGAIDEVRIWSVVRTQLQIHDNMNLEVSSSLTGLAGYWKLNETSGSLAVDKKASNNGSLYNMTDEDWAAILNTTSISFPGLEYSSQDWGDYDNDGDLDVILTGYDGSSAITKIYNNDNASYSETGFSLEGVQSSSVKWGDFNNDNYLDIILTGSNSSGNVTKIYKNNSGTSFSELSVSLENVNNGSVDLGDYNNDGNLDILLTGDSPGGAVSKIYKNNGNETFTEITVSLEGVAYSSASWGDYNNDSYLDILLSGYTGSGNIAKVYKNNGDETFTETSISLTGVSFGSADWGDYDNDGDLDILITGDTGSSKILKLYKNNGSGSNWTFTEESIGTTTGVFYSSADWGDYNNNGYLDFIATGYTGSSYSTKLYQNNLDGTFSQVSTISIADVSAGDTKWGDYDNDGDLDLLISGDMSGTRITKLYKNNCLSINNAPNSPTGLVSNGTSFCQGTDIILSWDESTDTETPSLGLSYNLRIGTTPGGSEIINPMSISSDGYRKVVMSGNVGSNLGITLKDLPIGTYYWSVQAIDASYSGSEFAAENSFEILPFFEDSGISLTGVMSGSVAWGDYDNDGYLDILLTGNTVSDEISRVYKNNGDGTFSNSGISFTGVFASSVAWGDYDNDGYLDILLTGDTGTAPRSRIYKNNGDGTFSYVVISLTQVTQGSVAWGDYDNDGDLDILLTGVSVSDVISRIYKNNGDGTFSNSGISLIGVRDCSAAWGDYDNDGYLDILLTGDYETKIYKNNGDGTFSNSGISLPEVNFGSAAWGDYDNDGYLDILLTGDTESVKISKIYKNNGDGTFSDSGISLIAVEDGSVVWGDYNNDGYLDILLTGDTGSVQISKIYKNNGDGTFSDSGISLPGVFLSSVAWGDYDNDDDLDILFTGYSDSGDRISKIYKNNNDIKTNSAPNIPLSLSSSVSGSEAVLSWDAATDNETPSAGLTYNLRIGTTPGGNEVMAPMADVSNGFRKISALGNTNHNTSWTLKDLKQGQRYFWSVQAIDNCFAGSDFSNEGTFLYGISADEEPGYALEFDGINDYVSGSGLITQNSAYTIEAWIYHNSLPASSQRYVTISPEVAVLRHDGSIQQGQLHFYIKKSDGSFSSVRVNGVLETGKWYHVAGVSDGTEMKLYLNGEEVGSSNPSSSLYANDGNFAISSSSETMDGYIDEVRVWNVVRSESRIRENMHKTLEGDENGFIGYWQLNDGTGSTTAAELAGESNGVLHSMDPNNDWVTSTVPAGGGSCNSCCGFTNGTENLGNLTITTSDGFDSAVDLLCTEIENSPNTNSGITGNSLDRYFVLSAFGTPGSFSANLTFTLPDGKISEQDQTTPSNLKLYRRESTADGDWTLIASGASATSTTVTFEGVTSFSQFIIGSESSVLPVELMSFTAGKDDSFVRLNWQTATEVNNYGFEIKRQITEDSNQESGWETVGFVEGHGNSSSPKSYEFVDENPPAGNLKYRLKQIDTDGSYEYYSTTASVNNSITDVAEEQVPTEFSLSQNYPNPFNPSTTIRFGLPESGRVMLELYNMLGQSVEVLLDDYLPAGYQEVIVNGSEFSSGVYTYRISVKGERKSFISTKKFVLMK